MTGEREEGLRDRGPSLYLCITTHKYAARPALGRVVTSVILITENMSQIARYDLKMSVPFAILTLS